MIVRRIPLLAALLITGFCTASLCHAEEVPNPEYVSWAKCKPGTSVTTKTTTDSSGMKLEVSTVTTLKEITPDKASVEAVSTLSIMGHNQTSPVQTKDISAKIEKSSSSAPASLPNVQVQESDEDLTIAGKTYHCHCRQTTYSDNGSKSEIKIWECPEIPGNRAKMQVKSQAADGYTSSTTTNEVTEIKIP